MIKERIALGVLQSGHAERQIDFPQVRSSRRKVVENLPIQKVIFSQRDVITVLEHVKSLMVVSLDIPSSEDGIRFNLQHFEVLCPPNDIFELLLSQNSIAEVNLFNVQTLN